jgi:hypothetical protein
MYRLSTTGQQQIRGILTDLAQEIQTCPIKVGKAAKTGTHQNTQEHLQECILCERAMDKAIARMLIEAQADKGDL